MAYEMSDRVVTFISLLENHFTVDMGVVLCNPEINVNPEAGTDEAVTVSWVDDDFVRFEESFTFDAIEAAESDGEKIKVKNTNGDYADFRFFVMQPMVITDNTFLKLSKNPTP